MDHLVNKGVNDDNQVCGSDRIDLMINFFNRSSEHWVRMFLSVFMISHIRHLRAGVEIAR